MAKRKGNAVAARAGGPTAVVNTGFAGVIELVMKNRGVTEAYQAHALPPTAGAWAKSRARRKGPDAGVRGLS
jgi:hypothetical protein